MNIPGVSWDMSWISCGSDSLYLRYLWDIYVISYTYTYFCLQKIIEDRAVGAKSLGQAQ